MSGSKAVDLCSIMDRSVVALMRHFADGNPAALIEEDDELLMVALDVDYPGPMHNAVFAKTPGSAPSRVIQRANEFFGRLGRRYVLWIGTHVHHELEAVALSGGLRILGSARGAAAMTLPGPARSPVGGRRPDPSGASVTLTRVSDDAEALIFVEVVSQAFAGRDRPQPREATEALFARSATLLGDDVVAHVVRRAGRPVAAAMTHVAEKTANIAWVSTVLEARGHGLATFVTSACVEAGLSRGARHVVLQSSAMGEAMYRRMGFEEVTRYRRLCSPEGRINLL